MIVSIDHFDWQMLRVIVRAEAKNEYPTGRDLRVNPTRWSKDGTFLDVLVSLGLIAVAVKPTQPDPRRPGEPAQFRTRYKLTDLGRHAAEYGEYDRPFTPKLGAVIGLAAQLPGNADAPEKPTARKKGEEVTRCSCCEKRIGHSLSVCDCAAVYCPACLSCELHCWCDATDDVQPAHVVRDEK